MSPLKEEKYRRTLFSEVPENKVNYLVSLLLQYIISHNEASPVIG